MFGVSWCSLSSRTGDEEYTKSDGPYPKKKGGAHEKSAALILSVLLEVEAQPELHPPRIMRSVQMQKGAISKTRADPVILGVVK